MRDDVCVPARLVFGHVFIATFDAPIPTCVYALAGFKCPNQHGWGNSCNFWENKNPSNKKNLNWLNYQKMASKSQQHSRSQAEGNKRKLRHITEDYKLTFFQFLVQGQWEGRAYDHIKIFFSSTTCNPLHQLCDHGTNGTKQKSELARVHSRRRALHLMDLELKSHDLIASITVECEIGYHLVTWCLVSYTPTHPQGNM